LPVPVKILRPASMIAGVIGGQAVAAPPLPRAIVAEAGIGAPTGLVADEAAGACVPAAVRRGAANSMPMAGA